MRLLRLLKNDLAKEAREWVEENIISEAQAEKICQRYNADYRQSSNQSFGYNVLVALGYLFIGLAIITILGANWDEIPRALRMVGLIFITLLTHALAIKKLSLGHESSATGLFLLANILYGASIILIAQIYHLGEHMPDGVFWWALGCLPIGVLLRNTWITLQSLILAFIWFFLEVDMGFYPALFPVFIAGSIYVLFSQKQSILLFLATIAAITCWIEYSLAVYWSERWYFDFLAEHAVVSIALFIFAYSVSQFLIQRSSSIAKDYGAIMALWCLRFGLLLMLIMSFEDPWKELLKAEWNHTISMYSLVCILCIAAYVLASYTHRKKLVAAITAFYLCTMFAVVYSNNTTHSLIFQIASNIALIAFGIWLILQGINHGISHYFFLGIATILLTALIRYIDLIGDYIGGAILFILFAIILLGAAKYWKRVTSSESLP